MKKTTNGQEKKPQNHHCVYCEFITNNKKDFGRHLLTAKHLFLEKRLQTTTFSNKISQDDKTQKHAHSENIVLDISSVQTTPAGKEESTISDKKYTCSTCEKKYAHSSSLSKHKKNCPKDCGVHINESGKMELTNQHLIFKLLKENQDFKELIIEQNKAWMEKPSIINNHTNSHNKQFNLQFFLNETCKNAMNITDFVDSLVIQSEELENFGKLGYVQGITNILMRGLKALDETERPLHCTDKKRETLYIKENNVWEKETSDKFKIKKLIKDIAFKNFKRMPEWQKDNPKYDDITTKKHIEYLHILNQVMTGIGPDDDIGINKIIRSISSHVYLMK